MGQTSWTYSSMLKTTQITRINKNCENEKMSII